MKCVYCGKELSAGDEFCSQCGKSQITASVEAGFGFRTASALTQEVERSIPESPAKPAEKPAPENVMNTASTDQEKFAPIAPVIPKRKLLNWKVLGCAVAILAVVVGGIYAISEGDIFSTSGSSRNKKSRKDRDDHDNHNYDSYYGDDYYDYGEYGYDDYGFDDYDYDDYDPQPAYFDCPGCTNGRHNLCNGTGTYSNYGYSSDCSCDDGRCNQCGGEGIIYYN